MSLNNNLTLKNSPGLSFEFLSNGSLKSIQVDPDPDKPQSGDSLFQTGYEPLPAEKKQSHLTLPRFWARKATAVLKWPMMLLLPGEAGPVLITPACCNCQRTA